MAGTADNAQRTSGGVSKGLNDGAACWENGDNPSTSGMNLLVNL